MGRLLHAKGLFLTLIFIFVHGTYGYATPILPEVNIDMQAVSRTIDNLHHCVRTHVPSASVSTPSTSITSNPETHARHVATLFRLLSRAAAQHCGVERHLVVSSTQGMGDRFRGIVSAFYLALLTHSGISVEWVLPASIDDFFIVRNFVQCTPMVHYRTFTDVAPTSIAVRLGWPHATRAVSPGHERHVSRSKATAPAGFS